MVSAETPSEKVGAPNLFMICVSDKITNSDGVNKSQTVKNLH